MHINNSKFKSQQGIALIVVLCFLVLLSLIVSTIVVLSQSSSKKIIIEGDRILSGYLAEGAAARMQWLLMADIKANPNSNYIGNTNNFPTTGNTGNASGMRQFMATGAPISIPYYDAKITIKLYDMCSGVNLSGGQGSNALQQLLPAFANTPGLYNEFKIFIGNFTSYIGTGFGQGVSGLGKGDYYNLGLTPLPRNGPMQYRDEILWIPGAQDFFLPDSNGRLTTFDVIANDFYANQVNFFAANKFIIMALCNCSDQVAQMIIDARTNWLSNPSLSLNNFIPQNYMQILSQKCSFKDSGNYTFIINASTGEGLYERELILSLKVGASMQGEYNQYYEYILY